MLLLGPPLPSVPLVSEDRARLSEFRLASLGRASRRGGIRSLMRSRPLASSKLLIRCCGEKPLMAGGGVVGGGRGRETDRWDKVLKTDLPEPLLASTYLPAHLSWHLLPRVG